jgi:hypothetical protein
MVWTLSAVSDGALLSKCETLIFDKTLAATAERRSNAAPGSYRGDALFIGLTKEIMERMKRN